MPPMERATFKRMSEAGTAYPKAGVISVAVIED
jgi:hypothetical protein